MSYKRKNYEFREQLAKRADELKASRQKARDPFLIRLFSACTRAVAKVRGK